MKRIPSLIAITLLHFFCAAQKNFQRIYGGLGNDRGHAVTATHDGGYAIAGHTNSFGAGNEDMFILKINGAGTLQWQKTYGSTLTDMGYSMAIMETPDSGLVVTGTGSGNGTRILDLYLFKTDAHGTLLWDYEYDSGPLINSGDHGRGLLSTSNGDILIVGTDDGDSFGSNDGLIIRTDEDGNLIWKKVYGLSSNEHLLQSIELPEGNFLACGSSGSFGPGTVSGYLVKIDPEGDLIWANTYGGTNVDYFHACDKTADSGIVVSGATTSFGAGMSDVLLCKIDSSGVAQWTRTFGGPGEEWGVSVKSLPDDSGFLLLAYTDSFGNGKTDILVIRTNSSGDLIWSKTFGTQESDRVDTWAHDALCLTPDGGFAITGWSDSLSSGGEDVVFLKSDPSGSILCRNAVISSASPEIISVITETQVASPGTYREASIIAGIASMNSHEICYCAPACDACNLPVVLYDMNDCYSHMGNGSDMDYSEFIPVYPLSVSFADISAGIVFRQNAATNKHSCTPGLNDTRAMCVSALNSCTYEAGNDHAVVFELTIVPEPDSFVQVTGLSFFEKSPSVFDWIDGASGLNNSPTRYGVRILKNDQEIFRVADLSASIDTWSEVRFDFRGDPLFVVKDSTTFRVELLGYCLAGNGAAVAAWDLDDVMMTINCDPVSVPTSFSPSSDPGFAIEAFPNPFETQTTIRFRLNMSGLVELAFFDISGRLLTTLDKNLPHGAHEIAITKETLGVSQGVVFCQLKCPEFETTLKFILIE